MKKLLLFILICFGCDETEQFISDLNEAPQINFTNNPDIPVLVDSIKLGLKSVDRSYHISLRITDKNDNISEVIYTQLSGTGILKQKDVQIINNNISFRKDSTVLEFDYFPEILGLHRLGLRVKDNFDLSNSVTLDITAFENLLPVAKVSWSKKGTRGKYHYEIRAAESFDRDARFGGTIEEYEYKVQGVIRRILATTENASNYQVIFEDKGIYPFEVRVRDNDGKWSTTYSNEIIVN